MAIEAAGSGLVGEGLIKTYSGVPVLKSVDFRVTPGNVVGLVGENGAGKSTLSSVITGVLKPDGGSMQLDGALYAPSSPAEALRQGVALIHQETRLISDLSVAENIFLGRLPTHGGRVDWDSVRREAGLILDSLGVDLDVRRPVRGLSMAMQQEIEIAKALSRKPRYVVFDEPSASLGESETEHVLDRIRALSAAGAGVVYISHRLDEVREVSDEIVCLRDGNRVAHWHSGEVAKEEIINAMVGREFTYEHIAPKPSRSQTVLEVRGLGRRGAFAGINFEVAAGEVLGIAGLVGAGRSEVVRAIAGVDRADEGQVILEGRPLRCTSPRAAIQAGVVMVPEDRKGTGLNLDRSAEENLTLPWERDLARGGLMTRKIIRRVGAIQRERFDVRGNMALPVKSMSGGNQQKILIGKWLVKDPKVLIVDEPTRGVDVGAKMAIYEIIRSLAAGGMAVIVVSSELDEVLGLSHRVMVMSRGRQQGILAREQATPQRVMALAVHSSVPNGPEPLEGPQSPSSPATTL
ncbi:sugar ABC transporter ATP-binding protein [Pseudarthrobacter enclensis]|uniref:Ribose transport system ATP-binding protein n=1 Tax=Pseudarthrobacter enclensis TaxID=993070 RepID=A0ABT9RYG4_9MICC|nr:sugar ABC transporter ATP-binding protein [Pseudarthrobacter enclensis]MDP9890295.1 ribose transport system ATP-binding protein [Pseudarthrobacter enclensis]